MSYPFRIIAAAILTAILASKLFAVGPPLPEQVRNLPPEQFKAWAQRSNAHAYEVAAARVTDGTYIDTAQSSTVSTDTGSVVLTPYSARMIPGAQTRSTAATYRTYNISPYGGGPVWLINPYTSPGARQ